jgi:hypothetical protein
LLIIHELGWLNEDRLPVFTVFRSPKGRNNQPGRDHHDTADDVEPKIGNIREISAGKDHCFPRQNAPKRSAPPHSPEEESQNENPQHTAVEK